jgi:hypothetical protein
MSLNPRSPQSKSSQVQAQLIDCLLASSTIDYPWNPAEPETADYYIESDRHFSLDEWSDIEIGQRSQSFFAQIQSCWENSPSAELVASPLAVLIERFGTRVPQQWLAQIAANVSSVGSSRLEPVEQLVHSVQNLLSNWATEDLLVMARPYAYAMRCDPGVDNPDNIVRALDWTELSQVERAKLTMLIAQSAIDLNSNPL